MILTAPSMEYDKQIQEYRREFLEYGGSMDGCGSLRRFDKTEDWLEQVELCKQEETTPPDFVPVTQYIYVRESDMKIVGVIQIRHYFNDYLEKYAGHIGYSVCPSERRKGYATQMLKLVLPECKKFGIEHVLICCIQENEGRHKTQRIIIYYKFIGANDIPIGSEYERLRKETRQGVEVEYITQSKSA